VSQIQTGRYGDLLRRFLGMKGVTEVAGELSPEISAVFILENDRPEWLFLKGEKLCSASFFIALNAGLPSAARLRNPAGSGVMAVIQRLEVSTQAGATLIEERNTDQGNLAAVLPTVTRDTRLPVLNASACIQSVANVGSSGEAFFSQRNLPDVPLVNASPFILLPGFQIQVSSTTNNIQLRGDWQWRERRLDVLEQGDG